jgi:NADPH-dependent curcumin reductase CurA
MQGFIVFNYEHEYEDARKTLGEWLAEGKLKRRFHIEEGLERCPEYLAYLFEGKNTGKM